MNTAFKTLLRRIARTRKRSALLLAAAALSCLCLFAVSPSAGAWTRIPESDLEVLTPEQRTLLEAMPEGLRCLTYLNLYGASASESYQFFQRNSPYCNLITRNHLYTADDVLEFVYSGSGPDAGTAEGRAQAEFLQELYYVYAGIYASYDDFMAGHFMSYGEYLQNKSLSELEAARSWHDRREQASMTSDWKHREWIQWGQVLDAWIVYRGGTPESQIPAGQRELQEAYESEPYPELTAAQQALLDAMPSAFRPLTYTAVTGTTGLSWFRENSGLKRRVILEYWPMTEDELGAAYASMVQAGNEQSQEGQALLQLYFLRHDAYARMTVLGQRVYLSDSEAFHRHSGTESWEYGSVIVGVEAWIDQRSGTDAALRGEFNDLFAAAEAWIDYYAALQEELAAAERAAAEAAAREWENRQEQPNPNYDPKPTAIPNDFPLTVAEKALLEALPRRYMPAAMAFLYPNLTAERFFGSYTEARWQSDAAELLALNVAGLEAEYLRLVRLNNAGTITEAEANRLELCVELLLFRYRTEQRKGFGYLQIAAGTNGNADSVSYTYYSDYILMDKTPAQLRADAARDDADNPDGKRLYRTHSAAMRRAIADYLEHRDDASTVELSMDDTVRRIYDATMPDMRVYAWLVATELAPADDLNYAMMPEQLAGYLYDYGTGAQAAASKILGFYGRKPYHNTSHPSFYVAADSQLTAIVNSVNQYTPEAIAEAQHILWHRRGEFYSQNGRYHSALGAMNTAQLQSCRAGAEADYYAETDAGRIAELRNWMEQIDAWLALRRKQNGGQGGGSQSGEGGLPQPSEEEAIPADRRIYVLETATGRMPGQKVEFFRIVYTTPEGDTRTQYVFPSENTLQEGYHAALAATDDGGLAQWVYSVAGYTAEAPDSVKALQSWHTDQFLFTADAQIASVNEIQVFARHDGNGDRNEWTCAGIRLYRMEYLRGLGRYGFFSSEYYLDYSGALLAELKFDDEGRQDLSWRGGDRLFRFGGPKGDQGYSLSNSGPARQYAAKDGNVIFRIDFADQYQAGLECLATPTSGENTKSIGRPGNLCEALALRVTYLDNFGAYREVTLPAVTSTAAWSVLKGDVSTTQNYAGLAQQGESLAFVGSLPDYAETVRVSPILGGSAAASAAGLRLDPGSGGAADRSRRIAESENDWASILCIAVYDASRGGLRAAIKDGFLRYEFPSTPEYYYCAPDVTGLRIEAGGTVNTLAMTPYSGGGITPRDGRELYLITLTTDDVEMAGTRSEIYLRLTYEDLDGVETASPEFRLQEYANQYYGFWPGSEENFGYVYGLSTTPDDTGFHGNSLHVVLPIQGVHRFRSASIRLGNTGGVDEWQMRNLTIQTVEELGARKLEWKQIRVSNAPGQEALSDRLFSRTVAGQLIFDLAHGGAVDPANPVQPSGTTFEPILIQIGETQELEVDTGNVLERKDVDWASLWYNMTMADAMQDLGFLRNRGRYTIQVKVASNVNNVTGDDDSGSKNQFYFQLLFTQGGKSALVLANQQMEADGFRAGTVETFTINTSQAYGDLAAVRVIPEDISSDSDKYDKLKIDSITVVQEGNGQVSPLWRVNNVGWIGIDYRDEGESSSIGGVSTRSIEELSHDYLVTESSYAVNVQFAISTGQYKNRIGETTEQFQGELSAEIGYRDLNGTVRTTVVEDVVELMYAFNNRPARYAQIQSNGVFTNGRATSDPAYMFRPNHTDRFVLPLDGLEQLLYVKLFPRSSVNSCWNITELSASLIRGEGRRILNVAGEFAMRYADEEEPQLIAVGNSSGEPKYSKQLYMTAVSDSSSPITVNFSSEKVDGGASAISNPATVTELPATGADSFNLVLFPEGSGAAPSDYSLTASIRYTSTSDTILQNAGRMEKAIWDGQPVFYLAGLSAPQLRQLNSVSVKADAPQGVSVSGGYLQRVRSGFAVESYELGAAGNLERAVQLPFADSAVWDQELCLQLGPESSAMRLKEGVNDVAVSIHYMPDGPLQREFQTRRMFLSQAGVGSIQPGQIINLHFKEAHVGKITGITLIPIGQAAIELTGAYAVTQTPTGPDGELEPSGRFSFKSEQTGASGQLLRLNCSNETMLGPGSIHLLEFGFETAGLAENETGSLDRPVSLSFSYYDSTGRLQNRSYDDIRPYIQNSAHSFLTGETTWVRLMAEDVQEVRGMELTLNSVEKLPQAIWALDAVSVCLDGTAQQVRKQISKNLSEDEPLRLTFASIYLRTELSYPLNHDGTESYSMARMTVTEGPVNLLLGSGEGISLQVSPVGTEEGVDVQLVSLEPVIGATGPASLAAAYNYSEVYLAELYVRARGILTAERSTLEEKHAAERVVGLIDTLRNSGGDRYVFENGIRFIAPRNYTGANLYYRIILTAKESSDVVLNIDITVRSETDELQNAVSELDAAVVRGDQERARQDAAAAATEPFEPTPPPTEAPTEPEPPAAPITEPTPEPVTETEAATEP